VNRRTRRGVLAAVGASTLPLAGCSGPARREYLLLATVEATTLAAVEPVALQDLPGTLRGAVGRTLATEPGGGQVSLDRERSALEPAVARAIASTDLVVTRGERYPREGIYARLSHDYPVATVFLAPVAYEAVDEDATADRSVIGREGVAPDAFAAGAETGRYRTVNLPEAVETIVAEYDYLTLGSLSDGADNDYFELSLTRADGPGERGPVATVVVPTDVDDVPIYSPADLPGSVRDAFEEAVGSDERRVRIDGGGLRDSRFDGAIVSRDDGFYRIVAEVVA